MKLILANNQSLKFVEFYRELQAKSEVPFDYVGYRSLLFRFQMSEDAPIEVIETKSGKKLQEYDGVYINGYLHAYELAATVAVSCDALGIGYVNKELQNPPSLSKLSMYAKLSAARVPVPPTVAGTKAAIMNSTESLNDLKFPAVLKRADADRGIDNFKVSDVDDMVRQLQGYDDSTLWLVQEFIPNDGFYLLSFYNDKPVFSIFRSLEERPDKDKHKTHMYKPKGGANASLVELAEVPEPLMRVGVKAIRAMNRQIASVDCLYDSETGKVHVLEVNYNPQLVTISTYKEVREQAFLDSLLNIGAES